jgi:membrane protease YdiL (CAAX protease family)
MSSLIRRLSPGAEFALVLSLTFGLPIIESLQRFASGDYRKPIVATDVELLGLVAMELVLGAIAAGILRVRGWSFAEFDLQITWPLTGFALVLGIVVYFLYVLCFMLAGSAVGFHTLEPPKMAAEAGLFSVLLVCIVNPLFEEVFVVGYIINSLEKEQGALFAAILSTLVRLLYHLYQGPIAVVSIIPLGFLYAYVYWRWRKLWPLVLSHGLYDLLALTVT